MNVSRSEIAGDQIPVVEIEEGMLFVDAWDVVWRALGQLKPYTTMKTTADTIQASQVDLVHKAGAWQIDNVGTPLYLDFFSREETLKVVNEHNLVEYLTRKPKPTTQAEPTGEFRDRR